MARPGLQRQRKKEEHRVKLTAHAAYNVGGANKTPPRENQKFRAGEPPGSPVVMYALRERLRFFLTGNPAWRT
jgi:hypothetical protein